MNRVSRRRKISRESRLNLIILFSALKNARNELRGQSGVTFLTGVKTSDSQVAPTMGISSHFESAYSLLKIEGLDWKQLKIVLQKRSVVSQG